MSHLHTIYYLFVMALTGVSALWVQWRHQDLLSGGAKLEIRSWDTHGGLQARVQQLLDDL